MRTTRILAALLLSVFFAQCGKKKEPQPVVPSIPRVNPKQYTAKMDGIHTWSVTLHRHCLSCSPPVDSTYYGRYPMRISILDDSTFYEGDLNFPLPLIYPDPSNSYKYLHYRWHDSTDKYIYFENVPSKISLTMHVKYFYEKNRIEWYNLSVGYLDTTSSVDISE